MKRLRLETGIDRQRVCYAVEAALLLGFQSETAKFPVIAEDGEIRIPESDEELRALWMQHEAPVPEGYQAAHHGCQACLIGDPTDSHHGYQADLGEEMFDLDFREKKGLECMFGKGPFLKDEDQDLFPDKLDVKLILPDKIDDSMLIAACNLAYRFGMETTAYEGRLVADEGYCGNAVVLEYAKCTELALVETKDAVHAVMQGEGKDLEAFSAQICEKFPKMGEWKTWRDILMEMTDDFILRGADGQLAYLAAWEEENPGGVCEVYGSPEITKEQKEHFPEHVFHNYKSGKKIYEKIYELPWEVENFEQILEEKVYPLLREGDTVQVSGALSEDRRIREDLEERILSAVKDRGADLIKTQILCAYKQGFSWIDEVVIPAAREAGSERIEIYFKPFLPEGQTEWVDENGATPSYHNVKANDPDKWYDLPIRYLQELYPIEDILVRELHIAREQVVFLPYEGEEELTYLCKCWRAGELCYEGNYLAHCSERPYLDSCPELGKVHPATGYLEVQVNGETIVSQKVRTDLEEIWDVYQSKVLPDVRSYVEEKTGQDLRAGQAAVFP
ncbi:hypothetical protein ABXS75_13780 [Roseburia hominis]